MARGYPDFFGYSVFPNYGITTEYDSGLVLIASLNTETIITVSGKGKIYGGELWYNGNERVLDLSTPLINVDGVDIADETPYGHITYGWDLDVNRLIRLVRYGLATPTVGYISFDIGKDYTFGQSIIIQLRNQTAANITCQGRIRWAKVI